MPASRWFPRAVVPLLLTVLFLPAAAVPTYQLQGAATVEWTRAKSTTYFDTAAGGPIACVVPASYTRMGDIANATSHARCKSP